MNMFGFVYSYCIECRGSLGDWGTDKKGDEVFSQKRDLTGKIYVLQIFCTRNTFIIKFIDCLVFVSLLLMLLLLLCQFIFCEKRKNVMCGNCDLCFHKKISTFLC